MHATTYTCPLCETTASSETDIYVHLQISHRKSRVCNALVEAAELSAEGEAEAPEPLEPRQAPSPSN